MLTEIKVFCSNPECRKVVPFGGDYAPSECPACGKSLTKEAMLLAQKYCSAKTFRDTWFTLCWIFGGSAFLVSAFLICTVIHQVVIRYIFMMGFLGLCLFGVKLAREFIVEIIHSDRSNWRRERCSKTIPHDWSLVMRYFPYL